MKRFIPAERSRVAWASPELQNVWEPRIARIKDAWSELELLTVEQKIRNGAIRIVHVSQLPQFSAQLYKRGLHVIPLSFQAAPDKYANATTIGTDALRCLVLRCSSHVYGTSDDELGYLLGYPKCCREFFIRNWSPENYELSELQTIFNGAHYSRCNVLYRSLGIRGLFHLPCSPFCTDSAQIAQSNLVTLLQNGYPVEACWLHEILSWKYRVSSYAGILEVVNPVFKIVSTTTGKDFDRTFSGSYPENGSSGTVYPFMLNPPKPFLNGFKSLDSMKAAHGTILKAFKDLPIPLIGSVHNHEVVDLGCGDGELLRTIVEHYPALIPVGIEQNIVAFTSAAAKLVNVWYSDVNRAGVMLLKGHIALVAGERLQEGFKVGKLWSKYILVYSYGDAPIEIAGKRIVYKDTTGTTRVAVYENI